jgi:integrase
VYWIAFGTYLLQPASPHVFDPPVNSRGLGHTHASRLARRDMALVVIVAQLAHADTRMVEKHYGHPSAGMSPQELAPF